MKNDLSTFFGFVYLYFDMLPRFKTREETFWFVNHELEKINGYRMVEDYQQFRERLNSCKD
jgi:hypothetical protein